MGQIIDKVIRSLKNRIQRLAPPSGGAAQTGELAVGPPSVDAKTIDAGRINSTSRNGAATPSGSAKCRRLLTATAGCGLGQGIE